MYSVRLKKFKRRLLRGRLVSSNFTFRFRRGIRKLRTNALKNALRPLTKSTLSTIKLESDHCEQGSSTSDISTNISVINNVDNQEPQYFNGLLGSLKSLDPNAQLELWRTMIESHPFDLHQLASLRTAIENRIKIDIISCAPYEIARYIMSFLSPKDLCQAAQTCKSWQTVCEDNRLWREKCKEEGILDDELTLEALTKKRIINKHKNQERLLRETLPPVTSVNKSEWKVAYLKHMSVLRNWRTRNFRISEAFITPMQVEQTQAPSEASGQQDGRNNSSATLNSEPSPAVSLRDSARRTECTLASISGVQKSRRGLRAYSSSVSGDQPNLNNVSDERISNSNVIDGAESDKSNELVYKNAMKVRSHLMQLRCHEDSVITCLQYNPRTNTIVSGSDDQTLRVWNSETGRCITTLEGHTGGVWSSQLSPEDIVISGSTDRTLKVWKAHTGELVHTLHGHTSTVRCLALDGNYVVSGSRDTTLRLWDIVNGVCVHVFLGHAEAVRCVEYKNNTIVSGAYDHLVMVWDAKTGACRHILECHFSRIYSLQFEGRTIASGSLDSTICIWDAVTGKLRHRLEGHESLTSKMQLKGNLLVSANADSLCKVWNINTGECLQTLDGENKHGSAITSVHFNNRHVVTSSDDGTVKLWDIRNGKFIRNLIVLPTASKGGVVWRIRASYTKLICAVGSRTQTEDTHLLVLDFNE